jgi:hypothetical protein
LKSSKVQSFEEEEEKAVSDLIFVPITNPIQLTTTTSSIHPSRPTSTKVINCVHKIYVMFFDCYKQSLKLLLLPSTHPLTHPSIHSGHALYRPFLTLVSTNSV